MHTAINDNLKENIKNSQVDKDRWEKRYYEKILPLIVKPRSLKLTWQYVNCKEHGTMIDISYHD